MEEVYYTRQVGVERSGTTREGKGRALGVLGRREREKRKQGRGGKQERERETTSPRKANKGKKTRDERYVYRIVEERREVRRVGGWRETKRK